MSQLNIEVSPDFWEKLKKFMDLRGIANRSDAVRLAVEEALEKTNEKPKVSWKQLLGAGLVGELQPRDQWMTEDKLWDGNGHR